MNADLTGLSVIVPAHNVLAYIDACKETAAAARSADAICILIDDGSTDGSSALLQDLCQETGSVYLRVEGVGPGLARNTGLAHATTDFVTFVDADDRIHVKALAQLLARMRLTNADVGRCSMALEGTPDNGRAGLTEVHLPSADHAPSRRLVTDPTGVHGLIARRAFLNDKGIVFPAGRLGEDLAFLAGVAANTTTIVEEAQVGYVYVLGQPGQLSVRKTELNDLLSTFEGSLRKGGLRQKRLTLFVAVRAAGGVCSRAGASPVACLRQVVRWLGPQPLDLSLLVLAVIEVAWQSRRQLRRLRRR